MARHSDKPKENIRQGLGVDEEAEPGTVDSISILWAERQRLLTFLA
jgi:hypothetical protein